jgi:hypothetical protein
MGAILDFRGAQTRRAEASRRRETDESAEIVIFPGVRIERWSEDDSADDAFDDGAPRDPGRSGRS